MKTNIRLGLGITAATVALAATLVTAQGSQTQGSQDPGRRPGPGQGAGQQGRGGRMGGGPLGAALIGLDLTEEQRTKIAGLRKANREEVQAIETELRTSQSALHRELFADTRDAAKIADLAAKVSLLQRQLTDFNVKNSAALSAVLTAEQRAIVREREGRGGGGPRGGRFGRLGHLPHAH